jgi:molybdate transport system ATP-binding protein
MKSTSFGTISNPASTDDTLIRFCRCRIGDQASPILPSIDWSLRKGEAWVVTGPNGGGKSAFAAALAGTLPVEALPGGEARNSFEGKAVLVSFETAAALVEQERANDDSDFVEGGIDPGTSARAYITEGLPEDVAPSFPDGQGLETHPAVVACGIAEFLDRGLKNLSTGEVRRTLLAKALASEPALLVLDEPYEGLDAATRDILEAILEELASASADPEPNGPGSTPERETPLLVLVADRWERIPGAVNRVVELAGRGIVFSGNRDDYEKRLAARREREAEEAASGRPALHADLDEVNTEAAALEGTRSGGAAKPASDPAFSAIYAAAERPAPNSREGTEESPLVELRDVTVGWSGRKVLDRISWTVRPGEHWLIRGPNGSGKTTLLELITGDNPQGFSNDVRLFGRRRGSGETIWELKARMGIISYRLHLEYRYMDDSSLEEVLVSGLHDSIGLYREAGDAEVMLARRWIELSGFGGRGRERFGSLSYGEQRALLVARAAIKGPSLLILDEPCHGLDDVHRGRILGLLEAIAEHGSSTLLHVTHDPTEALACEHRVLELRPGTEPGWAVMEG